MSHHSFSTECLAEIGEVPTAEERDEKDANENDHYSQIFKLKALHLLAFFTLVYVGVEVTIGGPSRQPSQPKDELTVCRLDRHFHHRRAGRRSLVRLHICWILWRFCGPLFTESGR